MVCKHCLYSVCDRPTIISCTALNRTFKSHSFLAHPTPANEPTIETDSKFFASNLVSPKLLDFICFYAEDTLYGRQLRTFRVCGVEGDIVEIKNGQLFVNEKLIDTLIQTKHFYKLSAGNYEKVKDILKVDEMTIMSAQGDSLIIPIDDRTASAHNLSTSRIVFSKDHDDAGIFAVFSKHWNLDNFGAVKVPSGKYFVLGDNRHNALDSRYSGFVDKKDFVATVLWKK